MIGMDLDEKLYIHAHLRAGEQHRALGGTGAPPATLIDTEYAKLKLELDNDAPEWDHEQMELRREEECRAQGLPYERKNAGDMRNALMGAQARAHNEQKGITKPKQEYLRSYEDALTGTKLRSYAAHQPIARPELGGLMDPEDCGAALVTMLTGKSPRRMTPALRAMSEGVNVSGGLLVSEQLASTVLDLARPKSRVLSAGAQTLNMESDTCRIARLTTDPTITATGENAALPFSDAAFDSILLTARKYGCIVPCSNELLSDAPNAGSIIMNALTNAVAAKIDDLLLNGDTAFLGLMNDPSISETGTLGAIDYDKMLLAQWQIRSILGEPNAAILNPKSVYALSILRDVPTGSYLQPPPALSSVSLLDTTRISDSSLVMGDFSQLIFGLRQSLMISMSDVAGDSFVNDQTYFKCVFRADAAIARPHFRRWTGITY